MKKLLICIAFLGLSSGAMAQRVAGTHCQLQMPEGFEPAEKFAGYEHKNSGSTILVNEIPAPFAETSAGITDEALAARGISVHSREKVKIDGQEALLILGEQWENDNRFRKIMLISGNQEYTVIVTGNFAGENQHLESAITESVKSLSCNFTSKLDFAAEASFTINTTGTSFQPVHFMAGMLLFTADGKLPSEEALFTVGESYSDQPGANYGQAFTEKRFRDLAKGRISKPSDAKPIQVGTLKGHEVLGRYDDNGEGLLFLTILETPARNGYYIMMGQTEKQGLNYLPRFRRMTKSFQPK